MPGPKQVPRPRLPAAKAASRAPTAPGHALLIIDHERLQGAAWAEFHTARKRLDQYARALHRHEEIDQPAYDKWLHRTFPLQVTALRDLHDEVATKTRQIRSAQVTATRSGRSLKRVWHEHKEQAANPEAFRAKARAGRDPDFDPDDEDSGRRTDAQPEDFVSKRTPGRTPATREIYRRLVQHLHPDRGGAWTPRREHLWHEVQQAWIAGDGDWLARLEVEWETAHAVVGPKSPLSRLRAAIAELDAARRDLESKLQGYRTSLPWRFTLSGAKRAALARRVEAQFARDFAFLDRQLSHLNQTIAAWEEDWTRADNRPKLRRRRFMQRSAIRRETRP